MFNKNKKELEEARARIRELEISLSRIQALWRQNGTVCRYDSVNQTITLPVEELRDMFIRMGMPEQIADSTITALKVGVKPKEIILTRKELDDYFMN